MVYAGIAMWQVWLWMNKSRDVNYSNPEQVVERCSFSRSYVSRVFTDRFGGFSDYVNGLRLKYYDHYMSQHPNATGEAAAEASGFTSYRAYSRAKERLVAR